MKLMELWGIKLRYKYLRMPGYNYKATLADYLYNIGQLVTMFLMPTKVRFFLFELLRSKI
jgi:hypothetical protein